MALELVKGKYLVFVDSDDWIDRDMLEEYRAILRALTTPSFSL